nr:uncharacterized protein LOC128684702 [Cherax quadricarinatus]
MAVAAEVAGPVVRSRKLVTKKKMMHFYCCDGRVSQSLRFNRKMFVWQHISVSLDLEAGLLRVIYDDLDYLIHLEPSKSEHGGVEQLKIRGGGRLVVGQKLYSLQGDFIIQETLDGEVGDYRIYDIALEHSQIVELLNCRDVPELKQPLINLENGALKARGPTTMRNMSLGEICSGHITGFYLFFSEKTIFQHAYSWCSKLHGSLILPEDNQTNAYFFDKFVSYKEQCHNIWTHLFWMGSKGNLTTQQWLKLSDKTPVTWHPFIKEYTTVSPEFQCIAAVTHRPYQWAACPCDIETCIVCNFTSYPTMRLRGLCEDSTLDRSFSFRDNENFELILDGMKHIMIRKENGSWVMRSRVYDEVSAVMLSRWKGEYPVGVHTWRVHGDRCLQEEVQLLLTSCSSDEYTCDDGTCISKTSRCDLSIDCGDQSDEMNCNVVQVPVGYSPSLPPPTLLSSPVPILFSLNITSVREFNLASFTISIDSTLELKWKDRRLKFNNLQQNFRANKVKEVKDVWTPTLAIADGTHSVAQQQIQTEAVFINRTSRPLPDDDHIIREDTVYSGGENVLIHHEESSLTFKCHFRLQLYPFDKQHCSIIYRLQDVSKDLGVLVKDGTGVHFLGTRQLLEYSLVSEKCSYYTLSEVSYVEVELYFRNQYGYYIGNTFLPCILLVIICWLCFFFHISDFQDRIMVSLTSLLVLATFFTQTSQSIPKTSYLKLIDVWFIVLIAKDFVIMVALVYIEVLRLRSQEEEETLKGVSLVVPVVSRSQKNAMAWYGYPSLDGKTKEVVDKEGLCRRGREDSRNKKVPNKVPASTRVAGGTAGASSSFMGRKDYNGNIPVSLKAKKVNRMFLYLFGVMVGLLLLCFAAMCIFSALSN